MPKIKPPPQKNLLFSLSFASAGEHNTTTRFPPITNPQPSSVPDRISAAPPPPRQISPSNPRRRYTLSGAACSQNIPVCPIHQRGILVRDTSHYCNNTHLCCVTCRSHCLLQHHFQCKVYWNTRIRALQASLFKTLRFAHHYATFHNRFWVLPSKCVAIGVWPGQTLIW